MPQITGNVEDVADRPATGTLRVRASNVRQNAGGDAVVDERTYDIPILGGIVTGSPNIDPGPAKVSLSTGGRFRTWDVIVPEGTSIDLWDLIESQADYEPPVVSKVFEYMQRAEAAAENADLLPDGGTDGQVLTKSGAGLAWSDPPTGGGGGGALVEDPPGSGLYSPSSAGLTEDPDNPGLYLI